MECTERVSSNTFYPFQNKHQIHRHPQSSVKMLCAFKKAKISGSWNGISWLEINRFLWMMRAWYIPSLWFRQIVEAIWLFLSLNTLEKVENATLAGQLWQPWIWPVRAVVVVQLVERSLLTARGPQFESSHRQDLHLLLVTVICIEKTKIKKKRQGMTGSTW